MKRRGTWQERQGNCEWLRGFLEEANFPLPPLAEQQRIVAEIEKQFTRLDASVAALKRVQANLKRYRASVLKDCLRGQAGPYRGGACPRREAATTNPPTGSWSVSWPKRRARWENQAKRRGKYKEPAAPDTSNLPELPEGWVWSRS